MNPEVFKRTPSGIFVPESTTTNDAGGRAYELQPREALCQIALTGCFNDTFYASGEKQLNDTIDLCKRTEVSVKFLAKLAIYARQKGLMKDTPVVLLAAVLQKDTKMFGRIFNSVCNNATEVKKFVHVIRSGVVGRKSLGHAAKKAVRKWIEDRDCERLFRDSVGGDVTITDLIRMVHPKAKDEVQNNFFRYMIGGNTENDDLPKLVVAYKMFQARISDTIPDVPFQMLASIRHEPEIWKSIAKNAPFHTARMNLNSFARHGVFSSPEMIDHVASVIREGIDRSIIYQLATTYFNVSRDVPEKIKDALHDAMERACQNAPRLTQKVAVAIDISGSMSHPVTGNRNGATTDMSCGFVAALFAAAIKKNSENCDVYGFNKNLCVMDSLSRRDTIFTTASKIPRPEGGTSMWIVLDYILKKKINYDVLIFISDNESWLDPNNYRDRQETCTAFLWGQYKSLVPNNKLICIDLAPNKTSQVFHHADYLQVAGFSDQVFDVIKKFLDGERDALVSEVEKVVLP